MLLLVTQTLAGIVAFDDILESLVLPDEAELDDVIGELVPLEGAVVVDIDVLRFYCTLKRSIKASVMSIF